MGATFNRVKTWSNGEVLTASDLNTEFDNILNNLEPSGIDDESSSVATMQTTADPGESGSESLATSLQGEIQRIRHILAEVTGKTYWYESPDASMASIAPVGSIIPFYDFGTGGPGGAPLTFDTNAWTYCDGSTTTLSGSGSYTTPDLSNRYLVGFGTEGGGDMDTETFATAAVGNASHQVDVSHTHDHAHTHELSHTHTLGSSTYAKAGIRAGVNNYINFDYTTRDLSGEGGNFDASIQCSATYGTPGSSKISSCLMFDLAGTTEGANDATTDSQSSSTTSSGGSATQDIQPRSVRVRFIMRIA